MVGRGRPCIEELAMPRAHLALLDVDRSGVNRGRVRASPRLELLKLKHIRVVDSRQVMVVVSDLRVARVHDRLASVLELELNVELSRVDGAWFRYRRSARVHRVRVVSAPCMHVRCLRRLQAQLSLGGIIAQPIDLWIFVCLDRVVAIDSKQGVRRGQEWRRCWSSGSSGMQRTCGDWRGVFRFSERLRRR